MLKNFTLLVVTLLVSFFSNAQFTETFEDMPANNGAYSLREWTGNNSIAWSATDARTDQIINLRAITIRNGSLTAAVIPGGITSLTFSHQQKFTGSNAVLEVYINSALVGTANPTTTVASTTVNGLNITGDFSLEIRQVTPGLRIAIDDVTWVGFNNNPSCTEPASQPTGLVLNSTPTTVTGNFNEATPSVDEYLVVRSNAPGLSATPADGIFYSAGQLLGGGTVLGNYTGSSFSDNGLTPSTLYYYFVFAVNKEDCNGGPNYLTTNHLTGSVTTLPLPACTPPLSSPSNLTTSSANNFISGNFNAVPGTNRYLVLYSTSYPIGATPVNGTTYTADQTLGSAKIASFSSGTSFIASGLNTNTQYYLYIYTASVECAGQPVYSSTVLEGDAATTFTSTGIPTGYYNTATGLICQPLKTALKNITGNGYVNISYDGVYDAYQFTDIKPGTTNTIWDIYTDDNDPLIPETFNFTYNTNACGDYNSEGDCYNREHTTPKSWFDDASPMYSDIQHLLPTDGWVNGARSNWPYGEVTNAGFTSIDNQSKRGTGNNFGYTGTVFQPHPAFRGDVARISLYMATRYEDQIISQNWAGNAEASAAMLTSGEEGFDAARRQLQVYNTWYIRTLFKWMYEDPVSQKEIDRNNAIYYQSGQHNRNPFVDHPEYAYLIFQCTGILPVTITDFVAQKQNETVLLKWYATYETSFRLFEIERSEDGNIYNKIGEVNGQNLANYSFLDNALPNGSIIYYRLKMIDLDGSFSYSKVLPVRLNNNFTNALLYPNPTTGPLNIRLTEAIKTNSSLLVTDIAGRVVKKLMVNKGVFSIDISVNELPAGRYFISINDQQNVIRQSVVIIK